MCTPDLGGADAGDVPGRSCDREQEGAGKKKRKQLHGVPRKAKPRKASSLRPCRAVSSGHGALWPLYRELEIPV